MLMWESYTMRVRVPVDTVASRFFARLWKWFQPGVVPKAHIMTQEEYTLLMAKRKMVGKGRCQYCGADALMSVCDVCMEMGR